MPFDRWLATVSLLSCALVPPARHSALTLPIKPGTGRNGIDLRYFEGRLVASARWRARSGGI